MGLFAALKKQKTNAVKSHIDWRILVVTLLLVAIGIMMCFSSSSYTSTLKGNPFPRYVPRCADSFWGWS